MKGQDVFEGKHRYFPDCIADLKARVTILSLDAARLHWLEEYSDELEKTCDGLWRVSCLAGDFCRLVLRDAVDAAMRITALADARRRK